MSFDLEEIYVYKFTYNNYVACLEELNPTDVFIRYQHNMKGDSRRRFVEKFTISKAEITLFRMTESNLDYNFEERLIRKAISLRSKVDPNRCTIFVHGNVSLGRESSDVRWPSVNSYYREEIKRLEEYIVSSYEVIKKLKVKLGIEV